MCPASTDGGQQKRFFVIIMTSICAANVYHFWHDRKKCCVLSRLLGAPTVPGREIGAPADLTVERKAKDAFGTIPHHTTVPGTRGDFLSLPLSPLLFSTYYLSSPNSRRSPSARSSSFSPNSLFFPVVPFSPSEVAEWRSATVTIAPDSPLF